MNVARLNFSHGSQQEHGDLIDALRAIAGRLNVPVAILQDLAGPKVRTGPIAGGTIELESGATFTLTARSVPGDASGRLLDLSANSQGGASRATRCF